ncbi:MAG TPA: DUF192 domain-containing protein, partial [Thermoanaerobaculia bacterium]|nr:DUF192 domain-containing protein [Thermoanaerobaculia bacterium]
MKAAVVLMLFLACTKDAPPVQTTSPAPAPAQTATAPAAATGPRVIFPNGDVIAVEIAADDDLRAQGLMFRDHLRPSSGMLFFFPQDGDYGFWMKNTVIPLDMIWIDSSRRIVHVKNDVPPCRVEICPSYDPGVPARYVLELAAGQAAKHGLKAGDVVRFE